MDVIIDNENKDTAYKPRILGFIHFSFQSALGIPCFVSGVSEFGNMQPPQQ